MTRRILLGFAVFAIALGLSPFASAQDAPIKIGIVKYFFNDMEPPFVQIGNDMFKGVMKAATGLDGTLYSDYSPFEVAQKINDNELQLGVFHGHEFAWIQKKFPKLVPSMVIMNHQNDVRAYFIVKQDNPAKTIADLRGKKFDLPMGAKQHCIIYLNKQCANNDQNDPKAFFGSVVRSKSGPKAIDEVARGINDVVLVDGITLDVYKRERGPVFDKNLRILQQSNGFPSPVVVYKDGALPAATLKAIHNGLLNAHNNKACDELRQLWQIRAFEPIPSGFDSSLADSLKQFPAPK